MDRETLLAQIPAYILGTLDNDVERANVATFIANDAEAQAIATNYEAICDTLAFIAPAKQAPVYLRNDLKQRLKQSTNSAKKETLRPPYWQIASVAVIALVLIGVSFIMAIVNRPTVPIDNQHFYEMIANATDSRRINIVSDLNAEGDLVVSADGETAILRVVQLPPLENEQVFELWLVHSDDGVSSGGVFAFDDPLDTHYITVPLSDNFDTYNGFGISLEDNGGSPFPDRPAGSQVLRIPVNET